MYNCIHLYRGLPDAAYRSRFYSVEFKLLYPRIFLISDSCVLLEKHTVNRYVNSPYLRFLAEIAFCIF